MPNAKGWNDPETGTVGLGGASAAPCRLGGLGPTPLPTPLHPREHSLAPANSRSLHLTVTVPKAQVLMVVEPGWGSGPRGRKDRPPQRDGVAGTRPAEAGPDCRDAGGPAGSQSLQSDGQVQRAGRSDGDGDVSEGLCVLK